MENAARYQRSRIAPCIALAFVLANGTTAHSQSAPPDDGLGIPDNFLAVPADLSRAKRRDAKESEDWTMTVVGTLAAGYNSNIHESPNDPQGSAMGGFGARIEALKYFGSSHRMKVAAEATGLPQTEGSDTSPYDQTLDFFYAFEPTRTLALTTHDSAEHHDGKGTTIDGDELDRDLEYFAYDSTNAVTYNLTRNQDIRVSYTVEGRDYAETSDMPSLDWWKHGPRVAYDITPIKTVKLEAYYSFYVQRYLDNPASLDTGSELTTNPDEKHYFNKVGGGVGWTPRDDVSTSLSYTYKRKDDRFQDFESYSSHTAEMKVEWDPYSRWSIQLAGWFGHRDFDERPASDGGTLEYDRWTAFFGNAYRITDHMTLFVDYEFDDRNTNRSTGFSTFRDYDVHRVLVGWSIAY